VGTSFGNPGVSTKPGQLQVRVSFSPVTTIRKP
jgi:hypothetical protein